MGKGKDPAFLWYPGDYLAGTAEYSFEEKGAYVELLMKQFEHGGALSEDRIKRILREKYSLIWSVICEKFKQDENGNWFNERLEKERVKRKNFTSSRRKNLEGKKEDHMEPHMDTHIEEHTESRMENENRIEDKDFKYHLKSVEKNLDDLDDRLDSALNEIYLDQQRIKWQHVNFDFEVNAFREKVRGSPDHYARHDSGGIRLALQSQLRNAKHKGNGISKTGREQAVNSRREGFAKRHSSDAGN
jgi:uncharacterized protein YdaU (DUF1376 family)